MEYGLVAVWVLAFAALAAVGLPIAARLFASVPGRGAGFALPIALVIVTLVAFWVGHLAFGPVAAFLGVVALVALAALAYRGGVRASRPLVLDGRAIAGSAAVFLVAFLFFVAVRAVDPGITPYYEEFINFGLVKSLLRADALPPEDMWFAGEAVNYYYGGHLATALLTELTGTEPTVAYNLALAGFYALLAAAAFEFAGAIAAAHGRSRELAGGTAAFLACFAGNLLTGLQVVLWGLPDALSEPLVGAIAPWLAGPAAGQLREGLAGFDYWSPSRVIPGTLNEFPLTVWLNGQLHAYMMSTPFLLLAAGVLYSYYRTPEDALDRRRALVFGAIPVAAGFVAIVDLWSLPAVIGLAWLALTFAPSRPHTLAPERITSRVDEPIASRVGNGRSSRIGNSTDRFREEASRTVVALVLATGVAVGGAVVALPFLLVLGGQGTSIAVLNLAQRGNLVGLFVVHGAFLVVFVAYLRTNARIHERGRASFLAAFVLVGLVAVLLRAPAIALFVPLLLVGWYALRIGEDVGFETVLLVAGTGLVVLIEFFYVDDPSFFAGRQNTVDKVYMQTWVLWSVAAGAMLPAVARGRTSSWSLDRRQVLGTAFAVLVVGSAGAYGAFATYEQFSNPAVAAYDQPTEPTLDGFAFAAANHPQEAAAIDWLGDTVSGRPTLVSTPGGPYEWAAPAATYTGIPTVAGWWHAAQYHGREAFRERVEDVAAIYAGAPERRVELLRQYDVEYVYLGPNERERYDVRPFTELDGIEVAYENDAVTIYRVHQGRLDYAGEFTAESRTYAAGDLEVGPVGTRSDGRIVNTTAQAGEVVWRGPNTALPPGEYTAVFRVNATVGGNGSASNGTAPASNGSDATAEDNASAARLAVTVDSGTETVGSVPVSNTDGWTTVAVPFELERTRSNIEFRGVATAHTGRIAVENVSLRVENSTGDAARIDGDRVA